MLECLEVPELPKLGWVAVLELHAGRVRAFHGSGVERGRGWLVEGVWDGDFAAGGFHRAGHFFGSGVRVDRDRVAFVPSSGLTDRLFHCRLDSLLVVSNSLCLLLAYTGARLDPRHDYAKEVYAIRRGLREYDPTVRVVHAAMDHVEQLYYHHLVVDGGAIMRETPAAPPPGTIPSFAAYVTLLHDTLARMTANATSSRRRLPLALYATASSGYDSCASAALVRDLGVEACFTARRSNSRIPWFLSPGAAIDDGAPVARALGLRAIPLERTRVGEDELYFLAACCNMPAIAFHSMARHIEQSGRLGVVFTGFQGDYAWDVNVEPKHRNGDFTGCDTSGTSLSEIRLKSGFINAPVPYLYARAVDDLATIGASAEMAPWRLTAHPAYDRPIARRIVETAGVPRSAFGQRKRAVVQVYDYPLNRSLRRAFLAQLRVEGIRSAFVYVHAAQNRVVYLLARAIARARRTLTGADAPTPRVHLWKHVNLPGRLFTWASTALADRLAAVLPTRDVAGRASTDPAPLRSPPPPPPQSGASRETSIPRA